MNKHQTPPAGPTEEEVREHFGHKIPADAKLMRPAYTSIWALEDGTLLWDWRNGFADGGPKTAKPQIQKIMYISGQLRSDKSALISLMPNAVEVSVNTVNSTIEANILGKIEANSQTEIIAFTSLTYSDRTCGRIKQIAAELQIQFFNINLKK